MKVYYSSNNERYEFDFEKNIEYENSEDSLILINNKTNKTLIFNYTAKYIYDELITNDNISCETICNNIIEQYSIIDFELTDIKTEIDKIFFALKEQNIIFFNN